MLLRFGVSVLFGHAKVDDVDNIGGLGGRSADEEIVRLDVSVDHVLLVDGLDSGELEKVRCDCQKGKGGEKHTICLAIIATVLTEKRRLQWSNRSSRLGPSRSITSMLCKPSWPK